MLLTPGLKYYLDCCFGLLEFTFTVYILMFIFLTIWMIVIKDCVFHMALYAKFPFPNSKTDIYYFCCKNKKNYHKP